MPIVTTSASYKRPGRSPALPIAIAAVAIIAIVAIYLGTRASSPRQPQVPDTTDKPAPAMDSPKAVPATPTSAAPAAPTSPPPGGATSAAPAAPTSAASAAPTSAASAAQTSPPSGGPAATPPPQVRRVFDNEVENQLEILSRPGAGGGLQAPRVNMSHEETVEYLKRPVEIYEDDDEETVAAKERTAEMKTAALKYVEEGGTLNQCLRDYAAAATEEQETVKDVREEMKRILYADGPEAAQAYLDGANRQLRELNLPEVRLGKGLLRGYEKKMAAEREKALQ